MKLIIHGVAPAPLLQELRILPEACEAKTLVPYATTILSMRTSNGENEVLDILNVDLSDFRTLQKSNRDFTEAVLYALQEVADVSGESEDIKTLKALAEYGFQGFIAYFE